MAIPVPGPVSSQNRACRARFWLLTGRAFTFTKDLLLLEACACVRHPLLREEVKVVKYTTPTQGYRLSRKTLYNLHLSDLIGTDSLYNCSAWWCGPSYISHCLVTLSVLVGMAVNIPPRQVT